MKKMLLAVVLASIALGAQGQQGAVKEETMPVQVAKQTGIKKCLASVKKLADGVIGDLQHKSNCSFAKDNPNGGVFSCESEVRRREGKYEFFAFSLTPTAKGQCMGEITRVLGFDEDCRKVHNEFFGQYDKQDGPDELMRLRKTGGTGTIHLMTMPGGCTVIRRESLVELK